MVIRIDQLLEAINAQTYRTRFGGRGVVHQRFVPSQLFAHDDGRFANSPLKAWFDQLASGKGLCCSFADGVSVQDVDWDTTHDGR